MWVHNIRSHSNKRVRQFGLFLLVLFAAGCATPPRQIAPETVKGPSGKRMIVLNGAIHFKTDTIFNDEVTLMPQAYLSSTAGKKIVFQKRVNILGESQVFDVESELEFAPGTISELNPAWFGAIGYDYHDDTEAFRKVLDVAKNLYNSISIIIPIGRYFISSLLVVEDGPNSKKAINWIGGSTSNSSIQGSSLSWAGPPGGTLLRFKNASQFKIENLDFTAEPFAPVKYNLEFIPIIHNIDIIKCSFAGCGGIGSANINLNINDGDQVSEIRISQCEFSGKAPSADSLSQSAIKGGLANTKNFYITNCSFDGYHTAAVDIRISDIMNVEGCTFANNEIDISCGLGGTYAVSNYSEHSNAFFSGGFSSNLAYTTLINNNFTGTPRDGYVIREGSGSLVLINNSFGGSDQLSDVNRIRWHDDEFSHVYSLGNFYKNTDSHFSPFVNLSGIVRNIHLSSTGDLGGKNSDGRKKIVIKQ